MIDSAGLVFEVRDVIAALKKNTLLALYVGQLLDTKSGHFTLQIPGHSAITS